MAARSPIAGVNVARAHPLLRELADLTKTTSSPTNGAGVPASMIEEPWTSPAAERHCATLPVSAMRLDQTRFADVVVLAPSGRVDHATAPDLETAVAPHLARCAKGQDHLVLDFAGVDYISSAGLRVLMLAAKQAKSQGGFLAVAGVKPLVQEILEISRFTLVLRVLPTVREAVVAASPAAAAAFDPAS